jgi:hypothetical protein
MESHSEELGKSGAEHRIPTTKEVVKMHTNRSVSSLFSIALVVAVVLTGSGCTSVRALSRAKTTAPEDAALAYESVAQENVAAVEVVQSFYDWYRGYPGNVVVEEAYRSSEYLTGSFIEKVDELIASFDRGGYDPFLCAQDIPGEVIVSDEVARSGDAVTIVVHEVWNPGTEHEAVNEIVVELRMMDGEWKISNVMCK